MFPRSKSYCICVVFYKLPVKTVLKNRVRKYYEDSNGKRKIIRGIIFSRAWIKLPDVIRTYQKQLKHATNGIKFVSILRTEISTIFTFKRAFNKFGVEYSNFCSPLQSAHRHRTKRIL